MGDLLDLLSRASLLGLAIAAAWAGLQRGRLKNRDDTIAGLRGDLEDARKRVADRDAELVDRDAELNEKDNKINDLETTVKVATDMVTGEAHLVALGEQADEHHRIVMEKLGAILRNTEPRP